jgi:hypothetical protein
MYIAIKVLDGTNRSFPRLTLTAPTMESRKRPHDGEEPVSVKKRVIQSSPDSPVTAVSSSVAAEEQPFAKELEVRSLNPSSILQTEYAGYETS